MAADAEMERVKPLISYRQPFLLWEHRVWRMRATGLDTVRQIYYLIMRMSLSER
jgi:hypothetical protein